MRNILKYLLFLGVVTSSSAALSLEFPLPSANFVPAKMPMHAVYPRPDAETQAHARHRWAHPNFRYEIPIGVQGGAWPFKYEIISGPAGATIGAYYGDADYGIVKWVPNASSGTKTFTVRVTDQELNTIDLTWTTTIDATKFIFIQDGYSGAKIGTIDQPLESFSDWYKGDRTDSTFHNKIVVFRGGNYSAYGAIATNGNVRLDANSKTPSLIGFPDEMPVIDCSKAKIYADNGALRDLFIAGIRWENARRDVNNSHFFLVTGDSDRATFWGNYFYKLGNGTSGTDNPSAIYISGTAQDKYNILIKHNTFDLFTNDGSNGSFIDMYRTFYVLIEENTAKNSNNQYGIWAKVSKAFVTIRANDMYENMTNGGITVHYGDAAPGTPHDHEICWNRIVLKPGDSSKSTFLMVGDALSAINQDHYNSFIYRNTFVNGFAWVRFMGQEPFEVESNLIINDRLDKWDSSIMNIISPNLTGSEVSGIVDSVGNLTGSYHQQFLGIIGYEVSSKYVTSPQPPSVVEVN